MSNSTTEKESFVKEIKGLMEQIEEKKVAYKKELELTQKSDKKLEEMYSEINKLIERVNELTKKLKELNGMK